MAPFSSPAAYLSLVLLFFEVNAQGHVTWASFEAQGTYVIEDGVINSKCKALPNTLEIRADGAWLFAPEFLLEGHFQEDCGISVTISVPSDGMKVTLGKEKTEFAKEVKELEDAKRALESDKEEHEKKRVDVMKERTEAEEKKEEMDGEEERMKKKKEEMEEKEKLLDGRKDRAEKRRKALKSMGERLSEEMEKYSTQFVASEKKIRQMEKEMKDLAEKKERLRQLYNSCQLLEYYAIFFIPVEMSNFPKLCSID